MPAAPPRRATSWLPVDTALGWADTHPTVARLRRHVPLRLPVLVLVLAIVAFVGVFAVHVAWRHDRFGTFDHDLGIWDQSVWLLARGKSFNTVRGLDVFGFHVSPALYLYVPFSWFGAGPVFLTASMVGMLAIGSTAVFRAARHHLGNEWHALVLALAFLGNYAAQWMIHETFHPEVMAITPLLFAYLAAVEGRWRAYALWLAFALAWKEDVALAGLALGFVLAVRGTRTVTGRRGPAATRRVGLWSMAACAGWFVLATQVIIPLRSPGGNFTEDLYGDLGGSPTEIAVTAVDDPTIVLEHLERSDPLHYTADLLASYGFVPLAAPLILVVGLPQAAVNLLAVYDFFWTTRVHYAAMPLLATTLAAVEGVAAARSLPVRRFFLGLVAVGGFTTAMFWGISPASPDYRTGHWPLTPPDDQAALEEAVALPGPDDAVSASYLLVPHLTHRDEIYTFPNPWIATNWGVDGEDRPDPSTVDWIVLQPNLLNEVDKSVLAAALIEPDRLQDPEEPLFLAPPLDLRFGALADPDTWQVVVDEPDLFVAHRVRRPSG